MSGEANASEFEGAAYKKNYDAARGIQPGYYEPGHRGDADREFVIGGIHLPEMEKLKPGAIIFRLASFAQDTREGARGRWWISWETGRLFAERAISAHHFVNMARQHLAVPNDFNRITGVFRARVVLPLRAFSGVGGLVHQDPPAIRGGARRGASLPGGAELDGSAIDRTMKRQLFIPGLLEVPDAIAVDRLMEIGKWLSAFEAGEL